MGKPDLQGPPSPMALLTLGGFKALLNTSHIFPLRDTNQVSSAAISVPALRE